MAFARGARNTFDRSDALYATLQHMLGGKQFTRLVIRGYGFLTCARVLPLMAGLTCSTRLTVDFDTPAACATSMIADLWFIPHPNAISYQYRLPTEKRHHERDLGSW